MFIIFGGINGITLYNDLWFYDHGKIFFFFYSFFDNCVK
jgi:hypothetical protein